MNSRRPRVALLGVATALLSLIAASCGEPGPLKLSLEISQARSGENLSVAESADTGAWSAYSENKYEVVGDLSVDRVSGFAWSVFQKNDTKGSFRALAEVFGVAGEVVKNEKNTFTIGVKNADGELLDSVGAHMYLWVDVGGAWWSYSSASPSASVSSPCAPNSPDCATSPPVLPSNLLSERDAMNRTIVTMTKALYNTATFTFTAKKSEWSTDVTGVMNIAGIPTNMTVSFSYGAEGALNYASGPLVYVKRANGYYMVSPEDAVKRLNDARYTSWGTATAAARDIMSQSNPIPDSVTIPITGARYVLMQATLTSKTTILLPAYTFYNESGDVGSVIAIEDKYLVYGSSDSTPGGSAVINPGTGGSDPGQIEPAPVAVPLDETSAKTLIGLTEEEAGKVASENGWTVRVAMRDGEAFMLTSDYSKTRVNLSIEMTLVTAVTIG
ncbi:unannotated protein [freshwater metagenome]|uniref:Unannotated protein n=1 Tax=freshwater metagenome TaxID=449393 RepID=A0A6J6HQ75_9ZZZZ|nr:hypothetical protein [Actinomycetota bacterium]